MAHQQLTQQQAQLFAGETDEKYTAFLELLNNLPSVQAFWRRELAEAMKDYFGNEGAVDGWSQKFRANTNYPFDVTWFLTDCGENSISLYLQGTNFHLWVSGNYYDLEKLDQLLKQEKFRPVYSGFKYEDRKLNSEYKIAEDGRWYFGSAMDGDFKEQHDLLAWYAGNKTKDFLRQIIEKVHRFRKNEQLTSLLAELNVLSKKEPLVYPKSIKNEPAEFCYYYFLRYENPPQRLIHPI